jgi:hypothetical protein
MRPSEDAPKQVLDMYSNVVRQRHADRLAGWPLLSGHNRKVARCDGWFLFVYIHTGDKGMVSTRQLGDLPPSAFGLPGIGEDNLETARAAVERYFGLSARDGVVIINPQRQLGENEFARLLERHEAAMGLSPMRVFLSHKGVDKDMVRRFTESLALLGFQPWLDEDAMVAGTELERGILQGFMDSCAAVFFVTPNFTDEQFLATEVNYAIRQKRDKGPRFTIITLVFELDGKTGTVPELLRTYVWKTPQHELDALREILLALPICVGATRWR